MVMPESAPEWFKKLLKEELNDQPFTDHLDGTLLCIRYDVKETTKKFKGKKTRPNYFSMQSRRIRAYH